MKEVRVLLILGTLESVNRADQVRRMLEAAGISSTRIDVTDMSNMDPANTRDSEISRAQGRRVTFEAKLGLVDQAISIKKPPPIGMAFCVQ